MVNSHLGLRGRMEDLFFLTIEDITRSSGKMIKKHAQNVGKILRSLLSH